MIYYILVTGNDIVEVFADCLLHSLSLYIMHKIRDDILAEKSQLPPVYYDPEPIPSGRTPYPQLPQQDQQSFVPANPFYAQLPQQYSPVPVNSSYPPTMQPQPLDPNMCPPLPQPSAPLNQFNNV